MSRVYVRDAHASRKEMSTPTTRDEALALTSREVERLKLDDINKVLRLFGITDDNIEAVASADPYNIEGTGKTKKIKYTLPDRKRLFLKIQELELAERERNANQEPPPSVESEKGDTAEESDEQESLPGEPPDEPPVVVPSGKLPVLPPAPVGEGGPKPKPEPPPAEPEPEPLRRRASPVQRPISYSRADVVARLVESKVLVVGVSSADAGAGAFDPVVDTYLVCALLNAASIDKDYGKISMFVPDKEEKEDIPAEDVWRAVWSFLTVSLGSTELSAEQTAALTEAFRGQLFEAQKNAIAQSFGCAISIQGASTVITFSPRAVADAELQMMPVKEHEDIVRALREALDNVGREAAKYTQENADTLLKLNELSARLRDTGVKFKADIQRSLALGEEPKIVPANLENLEAITAAFMAALDAITRLTIAKKKADEAQKETVAVLENVLQRSGYATTELLFEDLERLRDRAAKHDTADANLKIQKEANRKLSEANKVLNEEILRLRAAAESGLDSAAKAAVDSIQRQLDDAKRQLDDVQAANAKSMDALRAELADAKDALAGAASSATSTIVALQKENADLKADVARLTRELADANARAAAAAAAATTSSSSASAAASGAPRSRFDALIAEHNATITRLRAQVRARSAVAAV